MCEFRKICRKPAMWRNVRSAAHEIVYGTSVIHIGFEDWVSFSDILLAYSRIAVFRN